MDPGTLLATTHRAKDGLRVRLRLARPTDALRMGAFIERLDPEAVARAFPPVPGAPDPVRRLTFFDPRRRVVLVATALLEGAETIVGVAEVALTHPGVAVLASVVDEAHRRRGIGTLLGDAIAALARRQGAVDLRAA